MSDFVYVRTSEDPILKKISSPVEDFTHVEKYKKDLIGCIQDGLGIALPQIGTLKRMFVASIEGEFKEFINPKITKNRGYIPSLEGCLSIPYKNSLKIRRYSIEVDYQNINGDFFSDKYSGLPAIIIQHEIDHLNGKLI